MRLKNIFLLFLFISLNTFPIYAINCLETVYPKKNVVFQPSGMSKIDSIVCINLKKRPSKKRTIQELFANTNLQITFFEAVDGKNEVDFNKFKEKFCFQKKCALTKGQVGCILSHLTVLSESIKKNIGCLWIVEDDIEFNDDLVSIDNLVMELEKIDPDWDILQTKATHYTNRRNKPNSIKKSPNNSHGNLSKKLRIAKQRDFPNLFNLNYYRSEYNISPNIKRLRFRFGTDSLIFSRKGMKKMFNYLKKLKWIYPIDTEMHFCPKLKQYTSSFDIVTHSFDTLISDTRDIK